MKYKIYLFATLLIFSFIAANAEATNIVCTNEVLADFTENIVQENVTIDFIMPGGACPSHFDTTPSDITKIISADIVISLGWEPWLSDLIEKSGNAEVVEIKCSQLGEWSLPSNAKNFTIRIRDGLAIALPEQNETIQTNSQEFLTKIDEKSNEIKNIIEDIGYSDRKIICIEWYVDFLEWLGLDVVASYNAPESLSTQDQLNISTSAIDNNVCVIIDNLQSGTDFGGTVASASDASHVVFTNFPGAIEDVDTYLEMMNYNTVELIKGITVFDYKQENSVDFEGQISDMELQRNVALVIAGIGIILAILLYIFYKRK